MQRTGAFDGFLGFGSTAFIMGTSCTLAQGTSVFDAEKKREMSASAVEVELPAKPGCSCQLARHRLPPDDP